MGEDLEVAREAAHAVRFGEEHVGGRPFGLQRPDTSPGQSRRRGLEISAQITPRLDTVLKTACQRLSVNPGLVRAFVHAKSTIQAMCYASGEEALIFISSGLVHQLDDAEQTFVVGHELGHFLLDHHFLPIPPEDSFERYALFRAREISADRMGLIACQSPETAMRAIIKTFSGLADDQLRFDAASFLASSFDQANRDHAASGARDTHPGFAVRARCLVQFSPLVDPERRRNAPGAWEEEFRKIDARIAKDFRAFSEAKLGDAQDTFFRQCEEWIWVLGAIQDGRIAKEHVALLEQRFGAVFMQKVRSAFADMSGRAVAGFVDEKLQRAVADYRRAFPASAISRLTAAIDACERAMTGGRRLESARALLA